MRKQLPRQWHIVVWLLALTFQCATGQIPDTGIIRFPHWTIDLNLLDITRLPRRPDTLLIGEYVIAVERYDSLGTYIPSTRTFSGVSGIGRVLFSCRPPILFPHFTPGDIFVGGVDLPLTPFQFQVVDSVRFPDREIALQDARIFDKNIGRGAALTLTLPLSKTALPDVVGQRVTDLIQGVKPGRPQGIRVQFNGVQVQRLLNNARLGRITVGTAFYPAVEPVPIPPFTLDIEGFTLEVSRLRLSPDRPAEAVARLLLPDLISSGEGCNRAALDLGTINLSPRCEFYHNASDKRYGSFGIGNTTLIVRGKGYIADFSSTIGTPPGGGPNTWKGLILINGETAGEPSGTVYSNTGYLQAHYKYGIATVTKGGFSSTLNTGEAYTFFSVQPFGYGIRFDFAQLEIRNNRVLSGDLNKTDIALPDEAVRDRNGLPIAVQSEKLTVNNDLDMLGIVSNDKFSSLEFFWGEFTQPGREILAHGVSSCRAGFLFMPGQYQKDYYPVVGEAFAEPTLSLLAGTTMKALGMTGLTIYLPSLLFIQSPDVPNPPQPYPLDVNHLEYKLQSRRHLSWLNLQSQGVHASLYSDGLDRPQQLGDPASPYYVGKIPFYFWTHFSREKQFAGSIELHHVESAVFHSDVQGGVTLPMPTASNLLIRKLVFTSTAQIAGGEVDLSSSANLAYWGLELVPRPGFSSSGVLSVKTGQIILTAAGLAEKRHFKEPLYLTWGEMLANGSLGRLFFDYHTAGQQFDGFDFTPEAIALSDYPGSAPPFGFLRVGGTAHFPFFGNNYLHILDQYDPSKPAAPHNSRVIKLETISFGTGFFASDTSLYGNWSDGLAVFDIQRLYYNNALQNGFAGEGFSSIQTMPGGAIASSLILQSDNACISFIPGTDVRTLRFSAFSDITQMTQIWGCVCIRDDRIDNIVFGGSLTTSSNTLMVVARTGQHMSAIVRMSPSVFEVTLDGTATLSVALSLDMEVNGHLSIKFDVGNQFMEGEVDAYFRTAAAVATPDLPPVLAGASLTGQGQANWHIGLNPFDSNSYQSIQGSISMNVMGVVVSVVPPFVVGAGMGLNAGFYIGMNAPKSDAWVLLGSNPRYQLNMAALPDRLTGVYGFVQIKHDISLFILSGGYEVFVGLGAFVLDVGQAAGLGGLLPPVPPGTPLAGIPYAVGNLGGRIHGEFLGGLVGGSAWINLQLIGPYPFSFEGTIGIEGCVLWVACTTYHFTVGVNTNEGFYVRD